MNWLLPFVSVANETDWEALYERELPRILNYFRYRVGDVALAEDLTSATFEKAWRGRHKFRRDLARFSTWLFTIARNVATDHFRQRRVDLSIDAAEGIAGSDNPEQDALRRADFERLNALLGCLPERDRDLLSFKYGAGLTNREIARITGLSESNIGTILHRTIQSLREQW